MKEGKRISRNGIRKQMLTMKKPLCLKDTEIKGIEK